MPVYDFPGKPDTWKADAKLHIGISWAGSPQNEIDKLRNIPLIQFLDLYRVPGVQLYSLQVGPKAQELLPHVRHLRFSWETASMVFRETTLPTHFLRTLQIYPQTVDLHGHCAAALVSLVFNRGPALTGDRRSEMADIQALLKANNLNAIPERFDAMQRLWPNTGGLRRRRREEADLFRLGLAYDTQTTRDAV
jgi:hypothetical protein